MNTNAQATAAEYEPFAPNTRRYSRQGRDTSPVFLGTQDAGYYNDRLLNGGADDARKAAVLKTYSYTGAGLALSAGTAALTANALAPLGLAGVICSSMAALGCQIGINVSPRGSTNQFAAWLGFVALQGVALSCLGAVATPVLVNAAIGTAAVLAATTGAALVLPAASFRSWRGPMFGCTLGLLADSVGSLALPAAWPVTQFLHRLDVIGGLALFAGYMAMDTSETLERADEPDFDPLRQSLKMYTDVVSVFLRLLEAEEERRRR